VARTSPGAVGTVSRVLPVSVEAYAPHPLHSDGRVWTETNCSVDLWIEVLHSAGLDPRPASAFVLATDFQVDQWSFLKHPLEDLRMLYGIDVEELNVWRPLLDHVESQLKEGRLLTVEADAWYLPDTRGTSYRRIHTKSTIVPNRVDRQNRSVEYFHGTGYWKLDSADFVGIFPDSTLPSVSLPPYVELVNLDRLHTPADHVGAAFGLARDHFADRPSPCPVLPWRERVLADLSWLERQTREVFHLYAFAMIRPCGGAAELGADLLSWFDEHGCPAPESARANLERVAQLTKTLQFQLARRVSGRSVDILPLLDDVVSAWVRADEAMDEWFEQCDA